VGLMDGVGKIQVNHRLNEDEDEEYLEYQLIIKLSNLRSNYLMLVKIAKVIGGKVIIRNNGLHVI
jgi:hypothetical protein